MSHGVSGQKLILPFLFTSPENLVVSPRMLDNSVDLPEPTFPMTPTSCPGLMVTLQLMDNWGLIIFSSISLQSSLTKVFLSISSCLARFESHENLPVIFIYPF